MFPDVPSRRDFSVNPCFRRRRVQGPTKPLVPPSALAAALIGKQDGSRPHGGDDQQTQNDQFCFHIGRWWFERISSTIILWRLELSKAGVRWQRLGRPRRLLLALKPEGKVLQCRRRGIRRGFDGTCRNIQDLRKTNDIPAEKHLNAVSTGGTLVALEQRWWPFRKWENLRSLIRERQHQHPAAGV